MKRLGFGLFAAALSLGAGMLAVSCYSPDLSGVQYTCDEFNPYCPDGLECIGGVCLQPGSPLPDGGSSGPPDGTMAAAGCRSGQGFVVGSAFACPGRFNDNGGDTIPSGAQLCADNFQPCTMASGIDQAKCRSLGGFFAAKVPVRRDTDSPPNYACGTPNSAQRLVLFAGCGRNTNFDLTPPLMCGGFTQLLDCSAEQNWDCGTSGNFDNIDEQNNSADGVLCCPM
jgi:hypothetical protein